MTITSILLDLWRGGGGGGQAQELQKIPARIEQILQTLYLYLSELLVRLPSSSERQGFYLVGLSGAFVG